MMQTAIGEPKTGSDEEAFGVSAVLDFPGKTFELCYKATAGPLASDIDPLLAAALLPAMKLGAPLHLANPISPKLLGAVDQIQDIFHAWDTALIPVSVKAPTKSITAADSVRQVACFFSGGVDSFYTILKHRDEIDQLIFVHGFDIRLADADVWARISGSIHTAAAELGKPLIEVATNLQEFSDTFLHWNFYHGAALASVALLLSPLFRKVYVPATHTYAQLLPWGSHPLVDPLWSTETVEIIHDGCEATRLDKVRLLANSATALKYLRVCYKNRRAPWKDVYNCGQCEKCLRTKINLYLAGALDRCATFDHRLDLEAISHLPIPNESVRAYILENLEAAQRLGTDQALMQAMQNSLHSYDVETSGIGGRADACKATMQRLEEENAAMQMSLQALYQSRSWRLTGPLRALADGCKKLRSWKA